MSTVRRKPRMGKTSSQVSPSNRRDETTIRHLQKQLVSRLLLIFSIPLIVIIFLSVYAWRLESRIQELGVLEQIDAVERIYQTTHNVTSAIDSYDRLVKDHPYPQALVRLAALYYIRGETDDLKKSFDILERAKKANYWEAYSMLATIYTIKEKNEKKAIEEGTKAIEHNPYDASTYNNLAWIYATSKDGEIRNLAKAKEYAQKAVDFTQRREPSYLDTLAEVYSQMGKPDLASEIVKEEIKAAHKKSGNLLEPERRLKEFREAKKRKAEVAS